MESICRDVFCARKRRGKALEGGRIADANSVEVAASVHCITCCGELFGKHHCSVLVCTIGSAGRTND